jgi:hypothetical protein
METPVTTNDDKVLESLVAWGAPLAGWQKGVRLGLEETLVGALGAAHHNAAVLRTLPALVVKLHRYWKEPLLLERARSEGRAAELGFVLELAGQLFKKASLVATAGKLEDARRSAPVFFFGKPNRFAEALAKMNSPEVAKRWGFWLNMPVDAFKERVGA